MKPLMSIMQIILTILNFEKDVYEKTFTKNKKLKKGDTSVTSIK